MQWFLTQKATRILQFCLSKWQHQSSFAQSKPTVCVMQIFLHTSWQLGDLMAWMWQRKGREHWPKLNQLRKEESRFSLLSDADCENLQFVVFLDLLILAVEAQSVTISNVMWESGCRFRHPESYTWKGKREKNEGKKKKKEPLSTVRKLVWINRKIYQNERNYNQREKTHTGKTGAATWWMGV